MGEGQHPYLDTSGQLCGLWSPLLGPSASVWLPHHWPLRWERPCGFQGQPVQGNPSNPKDLGTEVAAACGLAGPAHFLTVTPWTQRPWGSLPPNTCLHTLRHS